jgi:hypothetical protein
MRHLIAGLLLLVVLALGAVAFLLYDPLAGGHRFMPLSEMIAAPPSERSHPLAEAPIQATDPPAIVALAREYEPTLVLSGYDRFWPTSLIGMLDARWRGHVTCLFEHGHCAVRDPTQSALQGHGLRSDYIEFPAPVNNVTDSFVSAAEALGVPHSAVRRWPNELADLDPFASAQFYFLLPAQLPAARTKPIRDAEQPDLLDHRRHRLPPGRHGPRRGPPRPEDDATSLPVDGPPCQ